MRVFLDASVWIAGILSPTGGSAALFKDLVNGQTTVLISSHTVVEVIRNLYKKAESEDIRKFFAWLDRLHPELIKPSQKSILQSQAVINEKDAYTLAAALNGKSHLLVTLDQKHFLIKPVKKFAEPMLVITPGEALKILRGRIK